MARGGVGGIFEFRPEDREPCGERFRIGSRQGHPEAEFRTAASPQRREGVQFHLDRFAQSPAQIFACGAFEFEQRQASLLDHEIIYVRRILRMKTGFEQVEFRRQEKDSVQHGNSEQPFRFEQRAVRGCQAGEGETRSSGEIDSAAVFRQFSGQFAESRPELLGAAASSPEGEFEPQYAGCGGAATALEPECDSDLVGFQCAVVDAFVFGENPQIREAADQRPFHGQNIYGPSGMGAEIVRNFG